MALLKNVKKPETKVISANKKGENVPDEWKRLDGMSLIELDQKEQLKSIEVGETDLEDGRTIVNLVIGFKNKTVAFPLSRGFGDDVLNDKEALLEGEFYVRKRIIEGTDEPGNPTGPTYISFGKPAGFRFDRVKNLVEEEEEVDEEK